MPSTGWRTLTVPARHPYVEAVRPTAVHPVRPDRVNGWEPDPFLQPRQVAAWADEIDLVHLHFGFDQLDVGAVRGWLDALGDAGLPLVFTVHDLRNPHHDHRAAHDAALAQLVPAAAAVLTLTEGAGAEINASFGRPAVVVPHPTLVDPSRSADVITEPGLVLLHLKSLRANLVDPLALVRAAAEGATAAGGRLRVDLHPEVVDDARLQGLHAVPDVEVCVHPRFDDEQLERYLRRGQVTVIPHRWGTHSGWLELARDLGTAVVAPSCGYLAQQWEQASRYTNDEEHGFDPDTLTAAVVGALRTPASPAPDRQERLAEAAAVRDRHAEVYARVFAGVRR